MALTEEQLEVRKGGIGASEIGAIAGLSPWSKPISVYLSKTEGSSFKGNWATEMGNRMEPLIAQWYAGQLGAERIIQGTTMIHEQEPWILATPDFFVEFAAAPRRIVEVKNVGVNVTHHWNDGVPPYVASQVYWQQIVTQVQFSDVAAAIGGDEPQSWNIEWNPEIHRDLIEIGRDFWFEHVLKGIPPNPDDSDQYADFLKSSFKRHNTDIVAAPDGADQWVAQRMQAISDAVDAESRRTEAENNIKAIIGENAGIWSQRFRATWTMTRSGGVDWKALALELGATPEQIAKHGRPGNRQFHIMERKNV